MKIFYPPDVTLTVTCEARYDVADTDVMFILDTTGSTTCAPSDTGGCTMTSETYTRPDGTPDYACTEKPTSRIGALHNAVMFFYDTLAANADLSTHIRYGFVLLYLDDERRRGDHGDRPQLPRQELGLSVAMDHRRRRRREFAVVDHHNVASKLHGSNDNRWQGCMEERDTTPSTSLDVANLPGDLDQDYVPDSDATRWKPLWPSNSITGTITTASTVIILDLLRIAVAIPRV